MARKKQAEAEENIFWVTMSDLFLGMFLFFAFVTNSGQGTQAAQEATTEMVQEVVQEMEKQDIKVRMIDETKPEEPVKDQSKVHVEMDPVTGLVRISDLELFALNSDQLSPKGRLKEELFLISLYRFILMQYIKRNYRNIFLRLLYKVIRIQLCLEEIIPLSSSI